MQRATATLARLTVAGLTVRRNGRGGLIVTPRDRITPELAALIRAELPALVNLRACPVIWCRRLLPWHGPGDHARRTRRPE
jgi:hypothetical protein